MSRIEKLNLIDGLFSQEEVNDILIKLFTDKINFYKLKNLSSQLKFEKDDKTANERMPELKEEIIKIQNLITEAKKSNKKFKITSEITISFSDN